MRKNDNGLGGLTGRSPLRLAIGGSWSSTSALLNSWT